MTISVNADFSGAPIVAQAYIDALPSYDHISIFGKRSNHKLFENTSKQFELPDLENSFNIFKLFSNGRNIYSIILKERPDIVICHSAVASIFGRLFWLRYRYKLILVNHGWPWRGFGFLESLLIKSVELLLYLISRATVIYLSEIEKKNAPTFVLKHSKPAVIYNSISNKKLNKKMPLDTRKNNFLSSNKLTIAMIARVDRSKDHQKLIDACKLTSLPINLVLVGEGTEGFTSEVDNNGFEVMGLGIKKNIFQVIEACDLVCLISKFETAPMSLIEACAFGKPIIASNVGSIPSIVLDGYNGYLVENNEKSIKTAIEKLYASNELRKKMGNKSIEHFDNHFSFNKFKEKVRSLVGEK